MALKKAYAIIVGCFMALSFMDSLFHGKEEDEDGGAKVLLVQG